MIGDAQPAQKIVAPRISVKAAAAHEIAAFECIESEPVRVLFPHSPSLKGPTTVDDLGLVEPCIAIGGNTRSDLTLRPD